MSHETIHNEVTDAKSFPGLIRFFSEFVDDSSPKLDFITSRVHGMTFFDHLRTKRNWSVMLYWNIALPIDKKVKGGS